MPTAKPRLTTLSYALMGLVRDEPRSGYALRRVFETTPMGNYSSSPGSIYPALKSLVAQGLLESRPSSGKKRLFALTDAGALGLEAWLRIPVTEADIARDLSALMMRFALLHGHPDKEITLEFLRGFTVAAKAQADALKSFLTGDFALAMPEQSQWAVRYGLMSCEATHAWSQQALAALEPIYSHTNEGSKS